MDKPCFEIIFPSDVDIGSIARDLKNKYVYGEDFKILDPKFKYIISVQEYVEETKEVEEEEVEEDVI